MSDLDKTVTSVPNALNIPANSRPTTPPPTTIRLLGTFLIFRISRLVISPCKSPPGTGTLLGLEPVAIIIFFASS